MKKKIIILLLIALAIFIFFEVTNDQEEHPDVAVIEKIEQEIDSNSTKDIVPEIDAVPEIDQVRSSENIIIVRKVESGENLTSILKKYGVTPTQLSKIASQEIIKFNFNNLHSGKKYKIILNPDSIIISFHYQMNSSSIASITFTEKLKYSVSESTLENVNADTPIEENENEMKEELTSKNLSMKDFLTGKFEEHDHPNFILLDKQYYKSSRDMYLQKETIDAFIKMHEAAKNAGINLIIVSGSRNFKVQKSIWERKHRERKEKGMSDVEIIRDIMIWSSMPSTSRHHWGTDIDINSTDDGYFLSGKGKEVYTWLTKHANKFGFCQVYNKKGNGRNTGYNEEKWHWSYMPLASGYLEEYKKLVSYDDINGFSSSGFAKELDIINEFVLGISKECGVE